MLFSAALSMALFVLLARRFKDQPLILLSLVFLPLFFSDSFIDYSTSGLENPLSNLLVVAFAAQFMTVKGKHVPWLPLSLFASLAV
ncbi:MAG: hypothetical protein EBT98_07220, partial [Opitutaceae bacterium]|nr:hypothetical protein [Opitutaceae bacterium]